MDTINIRYGERVTLPFDSGDPTAVSADIYVGNPGEVYILTSHTELVDGKGKFILTAAETEKPLGNYYYQINVIDHTGEPQKFPSPEDDDCGSCEDEFPRFRIHESLDETEVS